MKNILKLAVAVAALGSATTNHAAVQILESLMLFKVNGGDVYRQGDRAESHVCADRILAGRHVDQRHRRPVFRNLGRTQLTHHVRDHWVGRISPLIGMALDPLPRLFPNPRIIPQGQGNGRFAQSQLLGQHRNGH